MSRPSGSTKQIFIVGRTLGRPSGSLTTPFLYFFLYFLSFFLGFSLTTRRSTRLSLNLTPNLIQQQQQQQRQIEQEISLGLTLVGISLLFIICQSVKIIPDLYEMTCKKEEDERSNLQCQSTPFIETLIR